MKKLLKDFVTYECNAEVSMLENVFIQVKTPFEFAYFKIYPGNETINHNHSAEEIFICINGIVKVELDNYHICELRQEEVLYVSKFRFHKIINESDKPSTLISVAWN